MTRIEYGLLLVTIAFAILAYVYVLTNIGG